MLPQAHKSRRIIEVICPACCNDATSISGLVVKSNVAIVGPRVRFTADAKILFWFQLESNLCRPLPTAGIMKQDQAETFQTFPETFNI
jgi:hypothetical protein